MNWENGTICFKYLDYRFSEYWSSSHGYARLHNNNNRNENNCNNINKFKFKIHHHLVFLSWKKLLEYMAHNLLNKQCYGGRWDLTNRNLILCTVCHSKLFLWILESMEFFLFLIRDANKTFISFHIRIIQFTHWMMNTYEQFFLFINFNWSELDPHLIVFSICVQQIVYLISSFFTYFVCIFIQSFLNQPVWIVLKSTVLNTNNHSIIIIFWAFNINCRQI